MMKKADGSGIEESIVDVEDVLRATDISPDGRYLLLTRNVQKTGKTQIAFVDIKSDRKLNPILVSEYNVRQARFSPDGRWIVYLSDESGKMRFIFSLSVRKVRSIRYLPGAAPTHDGEVMRSFSNLIIKCGWRKSLFPAKYQHSEARKSFSTREK